MRTEKYRMGLLLLTLLCPAVSLSEVIGLKNTPDSTKSETTKKEAAKMDFDSEKVEKNIAGKVSFSPHSKDQAQIDESLKKDQNNFDDLSFSHIEKLEECAALKKIADIQNCKKDYLKLKKK